MRITIILPINSDAETTGKLTAGTIVSLRPEPNNAKDKNAVQAFYGETAIGYLANSKSTLPAGCLSASSIANTLAKDSVAGANAKLISSEIYPTSDAQLTQTRWLADVYPLPNWKPVGRDDDKPLLLTVGGSRVLNADKATVLNTWSSLGSEDLICKLMPSTNGGADKATIWFTTAQSGRGTAPAGEVINPPTELMLALQMQAILPVIPVKISDKNNYEVSVSLQSSNLDEFIPEMNEVVEACIMQVRDIKERVNYLLAQSVPANIIRAAMKAMRPYNENFHMKRPGEFFLQEMAPNDYLTRALAYHIAGRNIRLIGERGSGKNTLVSSVCWVLQQPLCRIQGNADMDKVDMLGSQALNDHGTTFELSAFVETLRDGGDVVLDEINAIKPEIAMVIHSLTDNSRSVDVPGYGYVEVHPGSRIWATMNEGYVGTSEMNSATVDRFTPIFLTESFNLSNLLKTMYPDFSSADMKACQTIYDKILKAVKENRCMPDAITTRGYIDALGSAGLIPLRATLMDNVGGRSQDEETRRVVMSFIMAAYPH